MPCLADGRDCLTAEIVKGNFGLTLTDGARRQVAATARLEECWRRGEWSHLAATWALAAGRLALYCDGHAIASVDKSWEDKPSLPRPATDRLIIGNLAGPGGKGSAHGLAGELDEVRLYSRALPPDQILQLYQSFIHAAAGRVHSTP